MRVLGFESFSGVRCSVREVVVSTTCVILLFQKYTTCHRVGPGQAVRKFVLPCDVLKFDGVIDVCVRRRNGMLALFRTFTVMCHFAF